MVTRRSSEVLSSWQQDDVALIQLHRDLLETTTNLDTKEELFAAIKQVDEADDIRALIFVGDPGVFDEKAYLRFLNALFDGTEDTDIAHSDLDRERLLSREEYGVTQFIMHIHACRKITMAAFQGVLAPPYLGIALAFDCRVVTPDTVFDLAFSRFGLPPSGGLGFFLPLFVGQGRAMQLIMCGASLDAKQALELGLVSKIVPAEDFPEQCRHCISDMLDLPLHIAGATKALVLTYTEEELSKYLDRECDIIRSTWRQQTLHARRARAQAAQLKNA